MNVQQSLQTTPPESFTSPPTPPATDEKTSTSISQILVAVRRHSDGYSLPAAEHWLRFSLDVYHYRDLQHQLRKANLWDHYEYKLRHDYFPSAKLYVLRMPGSLHESLESYITQEILRQLDTIAQSGSPSVVFAGDIENSASAEINFEDTEYGSHQPDASFQHLEAQYPGVILNCVDLFRDDSGNLVPDPQASLQLRLEDFGTEAFGAKFTDLTQSIHISAETLFTFLERAEAKARRLKQGEGLVRNTKPWVRKRRRDSTPPEHLDPDREGIFAEQEQRAVMMDDVSYKASSSEAELE